MYWHRMHVVKLVGLAMPHDLRQMQGRQKHMDLVSDRCMSGYTSGNERANLAEGFTSDGEEKCILNAGVADLKHLHIHINL